MSLIDPARAPFNELASLLQRLQPQALAASVGAFPQFENEVARGPNAGGGDAAESAAGAWAQLEDRARFSLELVQKLGVALDGRWEAILRRRKSVRLVRLVVVVAGASTGAATLGAFGLDQIPAARIASVSTAILAIVTAGANFIGSEDSTKRFQALADLRSKAYALAILSNELAGALAARDDVGEVVRLMEKTNKVASDLHRGIDQSQA